MLGESTLTVQIGTHTFFNATNGADHIDFNDPVVRQNLEKLAALIQNVEKKTGHKFDADITISGKYGYMMAPGAEGDAGRLSVGTYGWAEGNLALTEGLLYHEMGHHASKNVLYVQTIAVNASANNMLDSMEHFVRTDPERAHGWMIETFGSIENAQAFVVRIQPLIDSNTRAIQPILGKTDAELFEALKANPSLLEHVAGALDTEASTRLMTDEDLNLMGRMMDLQMQDKVLRAKNLAVIGAVSNDEMAPFFKEFIDGNALRDFPQHAPDTKFAELVEMLRPYRDNVTPAGHALAAAQRAEEYMADRYALQYVSDPEVYIRSLRDLEHTEVEGRKAFAQVQAATGFDAATHPTIDDRVARGREFVAGGRAQVFAHNDVPIREPALPRQAHLPTMTDAPMPMEEFRKLAGVWPSYDRVDLSIVLNQEYDPATKQFFYPEQERVKFERAATLLRGLGIEHASLERGAFGWGDITIPITQANRQLLTDAGLMWNQVHVYAMDWKPAEVDGKPARTLDIRGLSENQVGAISGLLEHSGYDFSRSGNVITAQMGRIEGLSPEDVNYLGSDEARQNAARYNRDNFGIRTRAMDMARGAIGKVRGIFSPNSPEANLTQINDSSGVGTKQIPSHSNDSTKAMADGESVVLANSNLEPQVGKAPPVAEMRTAAQTVSDAPKYSPTAVVAANDGRAGQPMTDVADGRGRNSADKFMPKPSASARPAPANDVVRVPSGDTPLVRVSGGAEDAARIRAGIPAEHIKGGLIAAGIGAAVRGGMAIVNDADGATVAEQAGRGVLDAAIPGAGDGFSGITGGDKNRPVNWIDRGLNALDTGTGAVATGGVVAAPVSEGASLVPAAVAGVANLAVNLAHDATYAAGLSHEGGIITGGKNIIATVSDAVQARAAHSQAKADIPQPVVEQFIAAMANAHGNTSNPALNNYFKVRDLAILEHRDGLVQSGSSQARFGDLPRTRISDEAMLARMDDAARDYLASGGTLELAQAALGQNAAQTQSAMLIQDLINLVPTKRTEGAVYPALDPKLKQLRILKQSAEDKPEQAAALAGQMAQVAADYLNAGHAVRDAMFEYYRLAPFTVDSASIAQAEKDPELLRVYDGANGGRKDGHITPVEIAAGMLKLGVYNSKVDTDHSGNLDYSEWKTATRTPSEFQSDTPSAGRK